VSVDVDEVRGRARDLWAWADGYEETNEGHARRCRMVARDVLDLLDAYEDERSGRVAMQSNYQRCLDLIQSRFYERMLAVPVVRHEGESAVLVANGNGHNPLL
jgi:hypothetical protein